MKNGCILCGGVGSGKSRTALGYYFFKVCEGDISLNGKGSYTPMQNPLDLYIITTAKKRDSFEWDKECSNFIISGDRDASPNGVRVEIDSWNNIHKYENVINAFFIFDEQRVVGYGSWTKTFLKIAKKNQWCLLSATPGDQWKDYIPVFIANGFYRCKTEFNQIHCIFNPHTTYPKIERYQGEQLLRKYRDSILVDLEDRRNTTRHYIDVKVGYDKELFKKVMKDRWDPYEDKPIEEVGKFYYLLRKVVNSSKERLDAVREIIMGFRYMSKKEYDEFLEERFIRYIIFYNFNYELDLLKRLCEELNLTYAEWNGKKHETIPNGNEWIYLVQYSAGCEGWNCTDTNSMIFFSQNYSYRMTEQAAGRIDRMNTEYKDLYYYRIRSTAWIDNAIYSALKQKKNFNERKFYGEW